MVVAAPQRSRRSEPRRGPQRRSNSASRVCSNERQAVARGRGHAGQRLGIKEVDDGIWLASFSHYDLGYFGLEQKTLQPLDNPFGPRLSPMS